MLSKVASQFPMIWLSCIGLLIFLSVFLGVLAWVFRKGSRELYDDFSSRALGLDETLPLPNRMKN